MPFIRDNIHVALRQICLGTESYEIDIQWLYSGRVRILSILSSENHTASIEDARDTEVSVFFR